MSTVALTVVHPARVSDRGADFPDWSDVTETEEGGWRVHPLSSAEVAELGRQGVTSLMRAIGPAASILADGDRAKVGGVTYDIEGAVERWPSFTGALSHVEVLLKRTEG